MCLKQLLEIFIFSWCTTVVHENMVKIQRLCAVNRLRWKHSVEFDRIFFIFLLITCTSFSSRGHHSLDSTHSVPLWSSLCFPNRIHSSGLFENGLVFMFLVWILKFLTSSFWPQIFDDCRGDLVFPCPDVSSSVLVCPQASLLTGQGVFV